MQVGQKLEAITYCPNVTIEHLHYSVGKSDMDASYSETNTPERYSIDGAEWENYLHNHMDNDIVKIKAYLGIS
jgi:hypothetical protein